jgi:hypothetical protein
MDHLFGIFMPVVLNPRVVPESTLHVVRTLSRFSFLIVVISLLIYSVFSIYVRTYGWSRVWILLVPGFNIYALWRTGIRKTFWILILVALLIFLYFETMFYINFGQQGRDYQMFVIGPNDNGLSGDPNDLSNPDNRR